MTRILVDRKNFQPGAIRVDIGEVHGVPMPQARRVEPRPVMIDRTRSVNDLVVSVAVHVTHAQVVVSLASKRPVFGSAVVAVKSPNAG